MFGTVWNGRGVSLAGAAILICGMSATAFAAGPKEVPGPGAEPECFAPWTQDTKYFQYPKKDGPYRIALANGFIGNTWRIQMIKTAKAYAEQPDVAAKLAEFKVVSTGEDLAAQIAAVDNFIDSGYDAVIVNAQNPAAFTPVIKRANAAGVVLVAFDNTLDTDEAINVNVDQKGLGIYWAEWLIQKIPDGGKVLEVRGVQGTSVDRDRHDGIQEALAASGKPWETVEVVGKWDDGTAQKVVADAIAVHKTFVGVTVQGGSTVLDKSDPKQGHRLIPGLVSGAPVLDDVFNTRAGLALPRQRSEGYGASLVGTWELNDTWTVKNILAYREDESTTPIDFDSLPAVDIDVPGQYLNDQTSEELQFLYSGDRLNGLIGAYYLDASAETDFEVLLATTGALIGVPGLNAQTLGTVNTKTWSVFADFTYDFSDTWALSLGGRYTDDKRDATVIRRTLMGGASPLFGGAGVVISTTSNFDGSDRFTDFSPRASLAWKPNPDNNVYFTYAKGFKGGGFDPRGQTSAAPDTDQDGVREPDEIFDFMQFEPEKVNSYELGWKASFMRGRFTTSLAGFWMDYQDVQVPSSIGVDTNGDGINDTFTGATTNAAAATLKGIEFDGAAVLGEDWITPGDELSATLSVGYIDAQYDEFIGPTGADVANQRVIQNTPDWTASTRIAYVTPFKLVSYDGMLSFINAVSYRGDSSQFEIPSSYLDQEAYTLWDMSLIFRGDDSRWSIGLHAKNLTDERYKVAGYNFVNVNPTTGALTSALGREGTLTAFYGDPRTYWLSLTTEF